MSPTQLKALEALNTPHGISTVTVPNRTTIHNGPKGCRRATLNALVRLGLAKCAGSGPVYENVPAGPFGKTAGYGYRSVRATQAHCTITLKGLEALPAPPTDSTSMAQALEAVKSAHPWTRQDNCATNKGLEALPAKQKEDQ